ncbi:MAG TPA: hemerythrin domain-containing protein [Candidatus Baltobacteraceae bacterium]|nr:hemerythrin domain-containing protein [Candidatus Baltobacteraceae bacterium]
MSDALQLLREQHAEASALFMKLERISDATTCEHIFRSLDVKLRDHTVIEEELFYPAFRDRAARENGKSEIDEAEHEHAEVKAVLGEIEKLSPTDYTFKTKIGELKRAVEHHVREEEQKILPQAQRLFSQSELDEMGLKMVKLMSIHSPVYQIGGTQVQTAARDTLHRIGDFISKIGS